MKSKILLFMATWCLATVSYAANGAEGSPVVATYNGNSASLYHQSGFAEGTAWVTNVSQPANSFISYGPYTSLAAGSYYARFELGVDNNRAGGDTIISLDVYDSVNNLVLAKQVLSRREFAANFTSTHFDLPFDAPASNQLQYRIFYHGSSYIKHYKTSVLQGEAYKLLLLGNSNRFGHQSGFTSGTSSWSTNVGQPTNTYMVYGPYANTTELPAGPYLVSFSLEVDDNVASNNLIARIEAYNVTSNTILAQRDIYRHGFQAAGTPTDFTLSYVSAPGAVMEYRIYYFGAAALTHLKTVVRADGVGVTKPLKPKLVVSIDQGFGNGIVYNGNLNSLDTILDSLVPLKNRYSVHVLLNPMVTNKKNLYSVLDRIVNKGFGFVFDVYSSDSSSLGLVAANDISNPDGPTSLSIPLSDLHAYKIRYRNFFSGMRIFEIFGQDAEYRGRLGNLPGNTPSNPVNNFPAGWGTTNPNEQKWMPYIPFTAGTYYPIFNPTFYRKILEFSRNQGMFVEIGDHGWVMPSQDIPGAPLTPGYQQTLTSLINEVGGSNAEVYFTYSNNANKPNNGFWDQNGILHQDLKDLSHLNKWAPGLRSISGYGSQTKLGLSSQSWMFGPDNTPDIQCHVNNFYEWSWSAYATNGARYMQLESVWSMFYVAPGSFESGSDIAGNTYPAGTPTKFWDIRQNLLSSAFNFLD